MIEPTDTIGDDIRLYRGDAMAVLPSLADGSVDAVVTDPPYSSGGMFRGDRTASPDVKYTPHTNRTYASFSGDNRDQRAYGYWCSLWLGECLRITREGGVCCLFTDWRQIATTIDALQSGGWIYRGIVPWNKTEAARPAKGRFRNQCEYVVWGSAGGMGPEVGADDDRECLPGFVTVPVSGQEKHHVAGKPLKVMRTLVSICGGSGTVLDPFMGSGSTIVAADQSGLKAIGIELDPDHYATALRRLTHAAGKSGDQLFSLLG